VNAWLYEMEGGCSVLQYMFRKLATFIFLCYIFVECNNCNIDWGGEDEMQLEW
jgi:hypothetical protein